MGNGFWRSGKELILLYSKISQFFFVTEYLSKNNITKVKNRMATGKRLKKPYFCADCGDRFLGKFALLDHINAVHDGKKPHSCGKCGKRFGILSNLNVHLRRGSCKVGVEEIRQKSYTTV